LTLQAAGDAAERTAIDRALRLAKGNKSLAARTLGISRNGLAAKLESPGIDSGVWTKATHPARRLSRTESLFEQGCSSEEHPARAADDLPRFLSKTVRSFAFSPRSLSRSDTFGSGLSNPFHRCA
jgi:hypothetical protein